jgi:sarcosine oxidase subunit beta
LEEDGLLDPGAALETLVFQARAAGALLVLSHPVLGIEQTQDGLVVRGEDESLLKAEVVVMAAGARCQQVDSWFEDKIIPVREQALLTSPVSQLIPGANRAGYGYTHFRQVPDGGLLMGGCRWATPHMEYGETDDSVTVAKIQEKLEATVSRLFPGLSELRIRRRWAWLNARTCDMLPIVGPLPGNPRMVACTGFVGNPYGLAPGAARAVADGLMKKNSQDVPSFMSAQRFL